MKTFTSILCILSMLTITSCIETENNGSLYVKFCNTPGSSYTITSIELKKREDLSVDTKSADLGSIKVKESWSDNILPAGVRIAPGKHVFFTIEMPKHYWVQYRIKVDDGAGKEVELTYQGRESDPNDLPITYWGGDDRTVQVSITYNSSEGRIWINSYSDFVGLDSDEETGTTAVN